MVILFLVDKGFTVYDQLNVPPVLASKYHFTNAEAEMCYKIGPSRLHVERANARIKIYEGSAEGAAQIRPADGFLHNHCPNSRGFTKGFKHGFPQGGAEFATKFEIWQ